ncbi:MAG: toll/interleukin-1 receptor domain-containing protein, partial [Blastocatellia bacterium]
PLGLAPEGVQFPADLQLRIEQLERRLKSAAEEGSKTQSRLAYNAATAGLRAMGAAREGRFTEAQSLFASSLSSYEHDDTITAYVLFMEDLGRVDLLEERFRTRSKERSKEDLAVGLANLAIFHLKHGDSEKAASAFYRAVDILTGQRAIDFYSCFISYSHVDKPFARRLYDSLQAMGVRCWLDQYQLSPGQDINEELDRGIRAWDTVLLCCSKDSLTSWWVERELQTTFEKERALLKGGGRISRTLIPLDLDGYVLSTDYKGPSAAKLRSLVIADFVGWEKDIAKFERGRNRLAEALRPSDPVAK